jgi:hypothetical protein
MRSLITPRVSLLPSQACQRTPSTMSVPVVQSFRQRALGLYREIIKVGRRWPVPKEKTYIINEARYGPPHRIAAAATAAAAAAAALSADLSLPLPPPSLSCLPF